MKKAPLENFATRPATEQTNPDVSCRESRDRTINEVARAALERQTIYETDPYASPPMAFIH